MSTMESPYARFIDDNLKFVSGSYISTDDLLSYYKVYSKSTVGKNKLYAELLTRNGVRKINNIFLGVKLNIDTALKQMDIIKENTKADTVETKSDTVVNTDADTVVNSDADTAVNTDADAVDTKSDTAVNIDADTAETKVDTAVNTGVYTTHNIYDNYKSNPYHMMSNLLSEYQKQMIRLSQISAMNIHIPVNEFIQSNERVIQMFVQSNNTTTKIFTDNVERMMLIRSKFESINNNKNRCLFHNERTHRFIDLQPYGTPSFQFIPVDNLVDVIGFTMFDSLNFIDYSVNKRIRVMLNRVSEEHLLYNEGSSVFTPCVSIDSALSTISKLCHMVDVYDSDLVDKMMTLSARIASVKEIASRDYDRQLHSVYQECKSRMDSTKKKMSKDKYIKLINKQHRKLNSNGVYIHCYTCNSKIELNSKACHRSHNVPQDHGGDWSFDNIYLCCANCNMDMSSNHTVMEYKANLYSDLLYKNQSRLSA